MGAHRLRQVNLVLEGEMVTEAARQGHEEGCRGYREDLGVLPGDRVSKALKLTERV